MSKPDNHIDETLADILHSLAWSGKYTDAGQEVVSELDIERAKNRLDQYYADFYRNKIPEKKEFVDKHGFYDDKTKLALINNFKGYNQALDDITAQFNSKGDNDE